MDDEIQVDSLSYYCNLRTETTIDVAGPMDDGSGVYYMVKYIHSRPEYRGQGSASELLALVCADADELGVPLLLECACPNDGSGSMDNNDLALWYWRNGFRPVTEDGYGDRAMMRREPR